MFGSARLVRETCNACVLMLLQTCCKLACSLADAGAWHFVDDVCLLLHGDGVFDLSGDGGWVRT